MQSALNPWNTIIVCDLACSTSYQLLSYQDDPSDQTPVKHV